MALVSGKKKNKVIKQKAESHVNSQMGQVQGAVKAPPVGPYCTANPPTSGLHSPKRVSQLPTIGRIHNGLERYAGETYPRVGPMKAATPQSDMAYARFAGRQISAMEAPPVASTGEPKNPVIKRNASSIPKLEAFAVGA